jgi:hypothetical protein
MKCNKSWMNSLAWPNHDVTSSTSPWWSCNWKLQGHLAPPFQPILCPSQGLMTWLDLTWGREASDLRPTRSKGVVSSLCCQYEWRETCHEDHLCIATQRIELIRIRGKDDERIVVSEQMQDFDLTLSSTRMKTIGINNIQGNFAFCCWW